MAQSIESETVENKCLDGEECDGKLDSPLKDNSDDKHINGFIGGDVVISRGENDYVVVSDPEVEELSSEKGNSETRSENGSVGRFKSPNSSIGSYTDIGMPDTEATMEVKHDEEVAQLVADAGKESEHGSTEEIYENEKVPKMDVENGKEEDNLQNTQERCDSLPRPDSIDLGQRTTVMNDMTDSSEPRERSQSDQPNLSGRSSPGDADDEMSRPRTMSEPGSPTEEDEESGTIFDNVLYLGSSTVNAPVSDIELKRTMAVLREQSTVSIPVMLIVGSTFDGVIRLVDPESKTDIAVYKIRKILFCGREDTNERDCFAFNTCHGDSDIFHCHVFRCKEPDAAGKILKCFAQSFRSHRKRNQQKPKTSVPGLTPGTKSLEFKFDITLDIQEDDGKGSFVPVARDKNCFKLRQNLQKQVVMTVQQLTNKKLIIERCFGLLISPGRGVRSSDMHLLDREDGIQEVIQEEPKTKAEARDLPDHMLKNYYTDMEKCTQKKTSFSLEAAQGRALRKIEELKHLLDISKMNYRQLGGELDEDIKRQEEERESARIIRELEAQLEYEREKREKMEAQMDKLRAQIHSLTVQLDEARSREVVVQRAPPPAVNTPLRRKKKNNNKRLNANSGGVFVQRGVSKPVTLLEMEKDF